MDVWKSRMKDFSRDNRLSDEELAAGAGAGSHHCFEQLVYRYGCRLFHFLRARMPTDQDTEDLVQETFLKIYRNIHRFDTRYKFSTWLYTAASRLAVSFSRKKHTGEAVLESPASLAAPADDTVKQEENLNDLWHAAKQLKQGQYQVLWLRYTEDMPVKEIAAVMKISRIHVRVLLHRARLNLAKMIRQQAPSTGKAVEGPWPAGANEEMI